MPRSLPVVVSPGGDIDLTAAPINPHWILAGSPQARVAMLSESVDRDASTFLWDCTEGVFLWHFSCDETVHIIDGSVEIAWNGENHRLGVGDTAYFPAGTISTWRVRSYVRKVAFLRQPAPRPVSLTLRLVRRLARMLKASEAPTGNLQPATARMPDQAA